MNHLIRQVRAKAVLAFALGGLVAGSSAYASGPEGNFNFSLANMWTGAVLVADGAVGAPVRALSPYDARDMGNKSNWTRARIEDVHVFTNTELGACLAIDDTGNLVHAACAAGREPAQEFKFVQASNGAFQLKSQKTGRCVESVEVAEQATGFGLRLAACAEAGQNVEWKALWSLRAGREDSRIIF